MPDAKMRADAALTYSRLLPHAGREIFAEHGLSATHNDVDHYAGVGVTTAYQKFNNKEELLDAICYQRDDGMEKLLLKALSAPSAWDGLVTSLEKSIALDARDRRMTQILATREIPRELREESRDRLEPVPASTNGLLNKPQRSSVNGG